MSQLTTRIRLFFRHPFLDTSVFIVLLKKRNTLTCVSIGKLIIIYHIYVLDKDLFLILINRYRKINQWLQTVVWRFFSICLVSFLFFRFIYICIYIFVSWVLMRTFIFESPIRTPWTFLACSHTFSMEHWLIHPKKLWWKYWFC